MTVIRFGHLAVCVSDLERSLRFYRDGLGFRPLSTVHVAGEEAARLLRLPEVDQRTVFLERDNVRLALYAFARPAPVGESTPRPMNALGYAAMAVRVDDLDATLEALRRDGVRVLDETRSDHPAFGSKLVFVCDPDGALVELIEMPGDPYAPIGAPLP